MFLEDKENSFPKFSCSFFFFLFPVDGKQLV